MRSRYVEWEAGCSDDESGEGGEDEDYGYTELSDGSDEADVEHGLPPFGSPSEELCRGEVGAKRVGNAAGEGEQSGRGRTGNDAGLDGAGSGIRDEKAPEPVGAVAASSNGSDVAVGHAAVGPARRGGRLRGHAPRVRSVHPRSKSPVPRPAASAAANSHGDAGERHEAAGRPVVGEHRGPLDYELWGRADHADHKHSVQSQIRGPAQFGGAVVAGHELDAEGAADPLDGAEGGAPFDLRMGGVRPGQLNGDEPVEPHPWAAGDAIDRKGSRVRSVVFTAHFADGIQRGVAELAAGALDVHLRRVPFVERWAYQLERCPRTHRLHLQGFISAGNGVSWKRWREGCIDQFPEQCGCKTPWAARAAAPDHAWEYATKLETRVSGPWVHGNPPRPGKRSDLEHFYEDVKGPFAEGKKSLAELQDTHFKVEARHIKYWDRLIGRYSKPRSNKTRVIWISGPAATGKSHRAMRIGLEHCNGNHAEIYTVATPDQKHSQIWWDGLNATALTRVVVFDEYAPGTLNPQLFNRLADKLPMKVACKGAMLEFAPELMFICSNFKPEYAFPGVMDNISTACLSRIDEIWESAYGPAHNDPIQMGRDACGTNAVFTRIKPPMP